MEPFKQKMLAFTESADKRIERYCLKFEEMKELFYKTVLFYKFNLRSGKVTDLKPKDFFQYWTTFSHDFRDIWRKEITFITNEL